MSKTKVSRIPLDVAAPFIEKWHYSHRCPTGKNIFFGWFADAAIYGIDEDHSTDLFGQVLYAVADYGIGVNPYQALSLSRELGKPIADNQLIELKRLCRIEPKIERLQLTGFLAKCHRQLKRDGYRYVVAFSDPEHGHNGGIYNAANFTHFGKTNAETHAKSESGEVRHRRLYFRYARRNNVTVEEARNQLGLTLVKTAPKDRWLINIGRGNL